MDNFYDAVIIGGGPAGLTAAIYLARARYRVVVVEKERFGGQIAITAEVVNYPGIEKTSGEALTAAMRVQAGKFGAEFLSAEALGISCEGDIKVVETSRGKLRAFTVAVATGANPRHLGFAGEEEFRGRGVAYCATCDGEFFTGRELLVIGGGFAAGEESLFLTRYASSITMLVRRDAFSCPPSIAEEVLGHPAIRVKFRHELVSVSGGPSGITSAVIRNNQTGEEHEFHAADGGSFGVFVFAGYVPNTSLLKGMADLDAQGYAITDSNRETSVPGIFAIGDVCIKPLRQVVTATADGALAACAMEKLAARLRRSTGVTPSQPKAAAKAVAPSAEKAEAPAGSAGSFISADMVPQLEAVFSRMQDPLVLEVSSDGSDRARELEGAMQELSALTEKLTVARGGETEHLPCVRLLLRSGEFTGLAFHGVPGGHEFTSFVLGLYNAAGPGQQLEEAVRNRALALDRDIDLRILVSLSCTMCPDLVMAAQRLAALNRRVRAEVYDVNLFPDLRDRYQVMSVPCLVTNNKHVSFGRKNITELLDYLETV